MKSCPWKSNSMSTPTKRGPEELSCSLRKNVIGVILYCSGEMREFRTFMEDKAFVLQLVEWSLRGVSQVIMADNPLSGAVILAAIIIASPWQCLLGLLGILVTTFTAIIIGLDSGEVARGLHGYNGMLVCLLIGVSSSVGAWHWWLLVPACMAAATCTFLESGLAPLLGHWDLPVSVYPFNTVLLLYLSCTGSANPYFPHYPSSALLVPEHGNITLIQLTQLGQGVLLGVGQIYACEDLWPSVLIVVGVSIYSPLLCGHALLGSGLGILAGLSVAVPHPLLYSGLSGFNGALGCMAVGGLFYRFAWRTHLVAIATAFLSAYTDIALSNLLGTVGLPASSWAATLTVTLMLLLTGQHVASHRIPLDCVAPLEKNLQAHKQWSRTSSDCTDV